MKYLKVFTDFAKDIGDLGDAERGRLFTAMLAYAETGEEPELRGNERFLWKTAKKNIDNQRATYAARCETNSRIATNRYQKAPESTRKHETCQDKDKDKEKDKERIDTLTLKGSGISPGESPFDAFWRAYPRKTGKGDARNKFAKALTKTTFETIMTALERVKGSAQWQRDGGQYIPHPATWLNQERWDDDPSAAGGSADGGDNLRHLATIFPEEE